MEFNEKLQQLRKSRGLTQEELAEALFVSRTAVSKWESGRGYPSIDSLKEISKFFSVTIDELLSGEQLISIAADENRTNIQRMCDLLCGTVDILSFIMIFLPLYPSEADGYICSVNLTAYTQTAPLYRSIYWAAFILLIAAGIVKLVRTCRNIDKAQKTVTYCSIVISVLTVMLLAMAREAYAVTVAFLLLIIKGMLFVKHLKA